MADRTIRIVFKAIADGFRGDVQKMAQQMKETGQAANVLRSQALKVGVALTGVATGAVMAFRPFEQSMAQIQARTRASADEMATLEQIALDAGRNTAFSAQNAARGIDQLASAGMSVADIYGGAFNSAMDLAAAGQLDLAQASDIVGVTMAQFGLQGADAARIADSLAAGATRAKGTVGDMAHALRYVGPVAHDMGMSLEDTVGSLAALANNGILAGQAGTSLRGVIMSLTSPSQEAQQIMDDLGISVWDSRGQFVGMAGVVGQLETAFDGMTDAQRQAIMGTIFGQGQITAASILFNEGAQGVEAWSQAVSESGFAAETAATMQNTLQGSLDSLRASLSTLAVIAGEGVATWLRPLVSGLESLVNFASNLPRPLIAFTTAIAGVAGAGTLAVLALGKMYTAAKTTKAALVALGGVKVALTAKLKAAGLATVGFGAKIKALGLTIAAFKAKATVGLSLVIGAVVGLFSSVSSGSQEAAVRVDELTMSFDRNTAAMTESTREVVARRLAEMGMVDVLESLHLRTDLATDALLGNTDALLELVNAMRESPGAFAPLQRYMETLNTELGLAQAEARAFAAALGDAGDDADALASDLDALAADLDSLGPSLDGVALSIAGFAGELRAGSSQHQDFQNTVRAAADPLGAFDRLISNLSDETREHAMAVAEASGSGAAAWQRYVDSAELSIDSLIAEIERNNAAHEQWVDDLARIAEVGGQEFADSLYAAGPAAAGAMVATLAAASDDEILAVAEASGHDVAQALWGQDAALAGQFGDEWERASVEYTARAAQAAREAAAAEDPLLFSVGLDDSLLMAEIQQLRHRPMPTLTMPVIADFGSMRSPFHHPTLQNPLPGRAHGGWIHGPGTSTSDSILARLSNGEFVVNARAASEHRALLEAINSRQVPAFATGGHVNSRQAPAAMNGSGELTARIDSRDFDKLARTVREGMSQTAMAALHADHRAAGALYTTAGPRR